MDTAAGESVDETATSNMGNAAEAVSALWVWGSQAVTDSARREQLFSFAAEKALNRIYLGAWDVLVNDPDALAAFIRDCDERGIGVELLFGEREWVFYENHPIVLGIADRVVDFSLQYPDARPLGVHLDVEPYILPEWEQDTDTVANQLVDLYQAVRQRLDGTGLSLVVDTPFWFDAHSIVRDGESRLLHELVIDAADGVALMDYRDTLKDIVREAENELQYAARIGRSVTIGVETLCIEPAFITFCEEGAEFMESVLAQLDSEMGALHASYEGHAIHHFDSYLGLQP